jgi:dihydroorotase-like cyclic amidohydrolase
MNHNPHRTAAISVWQGFPCFSGCSASGVHFPPMGFLRPNYSASFTVLNMTSPTVVTTDFLKTKCGHSPFLGAKFPGSLEALFLKGKIVSGKSKYLSV